MLLRGKLNIGFIDGTWGSGGKGKMNDFLANSEQIDFAITQNSQNASHIVYNDDGNSYKYNFLPSSVYANRSNKNFKVVAGADAVVNLKQAIKEIHDNKLTPDNLFIHPNMVVISDSNIKWEEQNLGYLSSTMTGSGMAKSMKIMRAKGVVTADMVEELKPYIANTHLLVNKWLSDGQTGILETAQGFDLSLDCVFGDEKYPQKFYPMSTSRNITPMSFLGASFVPHIFIGNIFVNFRTFPIRVGDSTTVEGDVIIKFKDGSEVPFLLSDKVEYVSKLGINNLVMLKALYEDNYLIEGGKIKIKNEYKDFSAFITLGSSGRCYPDQRELSWDDITKISNSPEPIKEKTSLTMRVRRVFSPSLQQIKNTTMCCAPTHISINFANYLDYSIKNVSGKMDVATLKENFPKVFNFAKGVFDAQFYCKSNSANICYIGTGRNMSHVIIISDPIKFGLVDYSQHEKRWI